MGGLIGHIERGQCTLRMSDILARREEMVEFNRRIDRAKGVVWSDLQLDLTPFMLDGPNKGQSTPPVRRAAEPPLSIEASGQNAEPRPSALLVKFNAENSVAPEPPQVETIDPTASVLDSTQDSGWGSNDDILVVIDPNAPGRTGYTEPTLDETYPQDTTPIPTPWDKNEGGWYGNGEEGSAAEYGNTDIALVQQSTENETEFVTHDPLHSAFDITRYWNGHMQQYGCPHFPCW